METLMAGRAPAIDADGAVAELFRTHRLGMVRLALLLVDDLSTAEDVVQEAFASLYRRWPSLTSTDAAVAYLRTSVINSARSVLRRRRTAGAVYPATTLPDQAPAAETDVLVAEQHRDVLAAIRALPRRQREVIVLRYWAGLSEPEVAATLGISTGAVKSTASRARDAIARTLGDPSLGDQS
jgi:RNA polymerase sigma-70 factor (sigma-E family)